MYEKQTSYFTNAIHAGRDFQFKWCFGFQTKFCEYMKKHDYKSPQENVTLINPIKVRFIGAKCGFLHF